MMSSVHAIAEGEDLDHAKAQAAALAKPLQGKEDAAGDVVWRFNDGDNCYIARANALENIVSLYHTTKGRRITIKYDESSIDCLHCRKSLVCAVPCGASGDCAA